MTWSRWPTEFSEHVQEINKLNIDLRLKFDRTFSSSQLEQRFNHHLAPKILVTSFQISTPFAFQSQWFGSLCALLRSRMMLENCAYILFCFTTSPHCDNQWMMICSEEVSQSTELFSCTRRTVNCKYFYLFTSLIPHLMIYICCNNVLDFRTVIGAAISKSDD